MLATKIEKHINFTKCCDEDLLDLLTVCSNALVQMKVQGYYEIDFQNAIGYSDLLQDRFKTIKEAQGFLETGLTQSEWAQLAHWCSQELQFRYNQENT